MAEDRSPVEVAPTYKFDFDPDTSYGSAVRLLEQAGSPGVVLDVGCGYGAIAGPLTDVGWTYVGVDLDGDAVADLVARGLVAAQVDLDQGADAIAASLREVLAGRELRAITALDVLEHLKEPEACLEALTGLGREHPGVDLVVSLPNVTHVDIAAKLLAGRWDTMSTGLLDRTHLHFFDERSAESLLAAFGWEQIAADDVDTMVTEQADPADLPTVRPGSPLNDLLRLVRARAGRGGATTFQFVRRARLGAAPAASGGDVPESCLVTVVALPGRDDLDALAADLAAQDERRFELILIDPSGVVDLDALASASKLDRSAVSAVAGGNSVDEALVRSSSRYVCALGPDEAIDPSWLSSIVAAMDRAPGRVLVSQCTDRVGEAVHLSRFDLVDQGWSGSLVTAAYAVPRMAVEAGVASFAGSPVDRAASLARSVMWCGRHDLEHATCTATAPLVMGSVAPEICSILDQEPLLLAAGAAGPLANLHDRMTRAETLRHKAEAESHRIESELAEQRAYHLAFARSAEAQLDELHTRLGKAARGSLVRQLARRGVAKVRRRR